MPPPTVSIVMPAAHAPTTIGRALDAISAQDYPHIVDVVVAAADQDTAEIARRHGAALVVDNPGGSTPHGLNLALAASRGDIVVRVDAHCYLPAGYVSRAVATLMETNAANVGGMQVPVGTSFWGRAVAAAMSSPAGSGDARYRIGGTAGPVETVYLGTYRRATLVEVGGYDESYVRHQDYELNQRIRDAGGTVWFDPELRVDYQPRSSLRALARQYFDYGTWKRAFARVNRGALLPRQYAPPLLTLALATAFVLAVVSPFFLVVPALYLIALLTAAFATIPRAGLAAFGVPAALATMHVSWGLGFLFGQTKRR